MAKQNVYNEVVRESSSGRCGVTGVMNLCEQVCCNLTKGDKCGGKTRRD